MCMQCAQGPCWLLMQVTVNKAEDDALAAQAQLKQ